MSDLISKEEAIKAIKESAESPAFKGFMAMEQYMPEDAIEAIRNLLPVTPSIRKGHWITQIQSDRRSDMWPTNPKCSECGGEPCYENTIFNYKFCPYCGAEMEQVIRLRNNLPTFFEYRGR